MYNCPHCNAPTVTFWQKNTLGPARSIECSSCHGKVTVPWLAAMSCISPIVLLGAGTFYYLSSAGEVAGAFIGGFLGLLVGYAVSTPLYGRYVPLVKR